MKHPARKQRSGRNVQVFSRRERQIMDIVYRLRHATAGEILAELPDPPSYSAVRSTLSILEDKGHLEHTSERNRYVYSPTMSRDSARGRALSHLVQTFFDASPTKVVSALLEDPERLSREELDELAAIVEQARREGR